MITNYNTSLEELVIALAIALEIALAQPPPLWHYGRQIRGAPAYTLSNALPPQILKLQSFGHLETICWISSWTTLDLENNLSGKKLYDLFLLSWNKWKLSEVNGHHLDGPPTNTINRMTHWKVWGHSNRKYRFANCAIVRVSADGDGSTPWHIIWNVEMVG